MLEINGGRRIRLFKLLNISWKIKWEKLIGKESLEKKNIGVKIDFGHESVEMV